MTDSMDEWDGGDDRTTITDAEPPLIVARVALDWVADIPNYVDESDIKNNDEFAEDLAERLRLKQSSEVTDYDIVVEREIVWGDPDHDVPVGEQLSDAQRELVGRDGGDDE